MNMFAIHYGAAAVIIINWLGAWISPASKPGRERGEPGEEIRLK